MRRWLPRLLSLCAGIAVVGLIYWRIDFVRVVDRLRALDPWWLVASLVIFVPLISLTALRLKWLTPGHGSTLAECHRLVLGASVLNMVLPSKLGDLAKAYWMHRRSGLTLPSAVSLVVFERCADLFAVCSFAAIGVLAFDFPVATQALALTSAVLAILLGIAVLTPAPVTWGAAFILRLLPDRFAPRLGRLNDSWTNMHAHVRGDPRRFFAVFAGTQVLWLLHLSQVWVFTFALGVHVPFGANLTINALGILAGLLPLTFAGVGTRDAALIALYAGTLPADAAAVVGLFGTVRYIVPALAGMPFLPEMLRIPPREH